MRPIASPYLLLSGINATSSLHATQDEVALPDVKVRLRQGGGVDANAKLMNYMAPAPPAVQPAVAMHSARKTAGKTAPKSGPQQEAAIHARIFGIRPEMVFEIIAVPKYANLGFDTQADGRADVWWKGSINDLMASANVTLAPPRPPTPNESAGDRCGRRKLCAARRQAGRAAHRGAYAGIVVECDRQGGVHPDDRAERVERRFHDQQSE